MSFKNEDMVEYAFYILTVGDNDDNALAYKRVLELLENVLANTATYFKEWTCFHSFQSGTYNDDMVISYLEEGQRFQLFPEPRYAAHYARGIAKKEAFSKCKPTLHKLADLFDELPTHWENGRQGADFANSMAECFFGLAYTLATTEEHESAMAFVANLHAPITD